MRSNLIALVLLVFAGLLSVASAARVRADPNTLQKRAIFDLGCPAAKLRFVKIDDRTSGVSGCGKRATYIESCDGDPKHSSTKCTWVMNSQIKR